MTVKASSKCPVCGNDKPHAHTRNTIATEYREKWLRAKFEKNVIGLGWFARWGKLLPGSYGMGIDLARKSNSGGTYWWWPIEMCWQAFRSGVSLFEPPWPGHEVPDLGEAIEIKEYPFGKSLGPIEQEF